ncbi:hypothetical protein AB0B45_10920 [Nonomuraea sp. NPDC049152]|uniref:hypothetical protein n=1 Tax=Nonomuraea sp. NPDC049152 TaxID=3154350 RepID=UPI00340424FF
MTSPIPPLARHRSQPQPPEEWEPERLSAGPWRLIIRAGTVFVVLAAVGIGLGAIRSSQAPSPSMAAPMATASAMAPPQGSPQAGAAGQPVTPVTPASPVTPAASAAPSRGDGARPAVTAQEAKRVHDRFQHELSAAQLDLDDKAVGELEQGLALEMTKASFQTARMQDAEVAAGIWPGTKVWVPRRTDDAGDWFVAAMHEPGVARVTDLLVKTEKGWRLAASTADTRDPAPELPAIAVDADGYAKSLDEFTSGLRGTPKQVALAHLRSLERATKDDRFAEGPWTSTAVRLWQRERAQLRKAGWDLKLSYRLNGKVRALRTVDGGALVWYSARSTEVRTAQRPGTTVTLKGSAAVRTANRPFAQTASATYGRMYLAHVPPIGSTEPIRVMGDWTDVLESHGT